MIEKQRKRIGLNPFLGLTRGEVKYLRTVYVSEIRVSNALDTGAPFCSNAKTRCCRGSIGLEAAVQVVFLLRGLALLSKTHD